MERKPIYTIARMFRLSPIEYQLLKDLAKELSVEAGRYISAGALVRAEVRKLLERTGKIKKGE